MIALEASLKVAVGREGSQDKTSDEIRQGLEIKLINANVVAIYHSVYIMNIL